MKPRPPLSPRTVRGWVCVNRGGHPFHDTVRLLRRDAISAYGPNRVYRTDRRKYGVQVVRCSITTEPNDG